MDLTAWYLLAQSRLPERGAVCRLPHVPRHPSASVAPHRGAQESSPLSALSLGEERAAQRGHPLPACALAWPPLCSKPEVKSTTEDSEEVTPGQSHPNMSALLP